MRKLEQWPTPLSPEKEKPISLPALLSYKNPRAEEYARIIERVRKQVAASEWGSPPDEYAGDWQRVVEPKPDGNDSKYKKFLEKKLKGSLLIDLGGGRAADRTGKTHIGHVAEKLGVKTYINVERFLSDNVSVDLFTDVSEKVGVEQPKNTKIITVKGDMLDFISRLPDNSANFSMNGIDHFVIEDEEYHNALTTELTRTTKPGGVVFGINCDAVFSLSKDKFERLSLVSLGRNELGINPSTVIITEKRTK